MVDFDTIILTILDTYENFISGHSLHNRSWKTVGDERWFGKLSIIKAKFYIQEKLNLKVHPVQTQHVYKYGYDVLSDILESPSINNCSDLYHKLYEDEEDDSYVHLQNEESSLHQRLYTSSDASYMQLQSEESSPIDKTRLESLSNMMLMSEKLIETNGCNMNEDRQHIMSTSFLGGFSRRINIYEDSDWDLLKIQLLNNEGTAKLSNFDYSGSSDSLHIAVSYKHKDDTFFWKMRTSEQTNVTEIKIERSKDMLFDGRWDQLKRCTRELGYKNNKCTAYLWLDRLVFLNIDEDAEKEMLSQVDWSSFGLWPYMVCYVIRLYNPNEKEYLSSFWRKIELYLGVNGKGVIVDDYMLNKYDNTFYFGEGAVTQCRGGTTMIGGGNLFLRSTVLALAHAVIEDGIAITNANEHPDTQKSISQWKRWAIQTICRNMYGNGPVTPIASVEFIREPIDLNLRDFKRIISLAKVTRNNKLIGNICPIDLALVKAFQTRSVSTWDGIREWIGFDSTAYSVTYNNKIEILEYINEIAKIEPFVANTGHRATAITLCKGDFTGINKGIVVETSRYSSLSEGHVLSISSFTAETSGKPLVPNYTPHIDPDIQQIDTISNTKWKIVYVPCKYYGVIEWRLSIMLILFGFLINLMSSGNVITIVLVICGLSLMHRHTIPNKWGTFSKIVITSSAIAGLFVCYIPKTKGVDSVGIAGAVATCMLLLACVFVLMRLHTKSPECCKHSCSNKFWCDKQFIGEGIVDNVILHKMYKSGIKSKYRKLKESKYLDIGWSGSYLQDTTRTRLSILNVQ